MKKATFKRVIGRSFFIGFAVVASPLWVPFVLLVGIFIGVAKIMNTMIKWAEWD